MKVDILLPTYNRTAIVEFQLLALEKVWRLNNSAELQLNVIVSDNHSPVPVQLKERFKSFCTLIRPDTHLPTAEQHLRFLLEQSKADYVWLLADEDPPVIDHTPEMFSFLQAQQPDLMILNASGLMVDDTLVSLRTVASTPETITLFPDFVQRTGLLFVSAGISCLVLKREVMIQSLSILDRYIGICPIYSHVFWLLQTYWDRKFRFFELPVVLYRQNLTDVEGNHWAKTANTHGVFQSYFWTLGLLRQMRYLRSQVKVGENFFSHIIDQNWQLRFHLITLTAKRFFEQLNVELDAKSPCRASTREEKFEIIEILTELDPGILPVFQEFVKNPALGTFKDNTRIVQDLTAAAFNYFEHFLIRKYRGWEIYHFDEVFRATLPRRTYEKRKVFGDIAPLTSYQMLVAGDLEGIKKAIDQTSAQSLTPITYAEFPAPTAVDEIDFTVTDILILKKILRAYEKLKSWMPRALLKRIAG